MQIPPEVIVRGKLCNRQETNFVWKLHEFRLEDIPRVIERVKRASEWKYTFYENACSVIIYKIA